MMKEPPILKSGTIPDWLRNHPSLQPWERGKACLDQIIGSFILLYSPRFYDSFRGEAPYRKGSELRERLVSCWVYYWEMKNKQWTPQESREYLLKKMSFHPLEDIVLSEAIYDRQNRATVYFQKTVSPYLRRTGNRLLEIQRLPSNEMEEWFDEFLIFLLDESRERQCVILRYMGLVPIYRWLLVVLTNYANNVWRRLGTRCSVISTEEVPPIQIPPQPLRMTMEEESQIHRFTDFLSGVLRQSLSQMDGDSRMRLEYLYLENLTNEQSAMIFQESPSVSSRKRQKIEERLFQELCIAIRDSWEWSEYEENFSKASATSVMKWMFDKK